MLYGGGDVHEYAGPRPLAAARIVPSPLTPQPSRFANNIGRGQWDIHVGWHDFQRRDLELATSPAGRLSPLGYSCGLRWLWLHLGIGLFQPLFG